MKRMYFLVAPISRAVDPKRESSLLKIKVSDTESAYLAASSAELAQQLLSGRPNAADLRVVEASALEPRAHQDLAGGRVLFIDSTDTLRSFMTTRTTTFPYEQHLKSYVRKGDN